MTTEIEKMYKLVGVKKQEYGYCDADDACVYPSKSMGIECERNCPFWVTDKIDYPNFTEKKQLELIKWLANKKLCISSPQAVNTYVDKFWHIGINPFNFKLDIVNDPTFEECLARLVNCLWQDLTEQEKEEIRRILE